MLKTLLWIFLTLGITSGCSYNNRLQIIEDAEGNSNAFRGIVDVINEPGDTNIIFIHGMGGYSSDNGIIDPCAVINDVRRAFELPDATFQAPQWYCDNHFKLDGKTVHMRSMQWGDITQTRKLILQDIDDAPTFSDNRAAITTLVKENLINSGFSDALMYTGVYRDEIINRVTQSYRDLSERNNKAKVVVVTFSLGSSIMLDSLTNLAAMRQSDVLAGKIEMVYMMANQIPLIQTGTRAPATARDTTTTEFYSALSPYLSKPINKSTENDHIRIVAFSDPNDLLSYPIDAANMGELRDSYVNVAVSVADKTWFIPFLKKQTSFVNYLKAHTGYVYDQNVRKLLLFGSEE